MKNRAGRKIYALHKLSVKNLQNGKRYDKILLGCEWLARQVRAGHDMR